MSLSKQQLTALEKSICHWNNVCMGLEPSNGGEGCACCQEFSSWCCQGCPVAAVFDYRCRDLGYYAYQRWHEIFFTIPENYSTQDKLDWFKGIDAAELILTRLISLLPPSHPWSERNAEAE
jgi:hypothetical protein